MYNIRYGFFRKDGIIKVLRRHKLPALVVVTFLVITLLTGCTTYENFKSAFISKGATESATITIGVFEPVTGSDSKAAEAEIRGIQLAHTAYPNIGDKTVGLVYTDNSSDIYAAETGIKNLISYKPNVILGSYGSVYSMVASDYIEKAKIPAITMTNANPLVTRTCEYYYRVCYADANQGDLLAQYVAGTADKKEAGVLLPKGNDVALARASFFTDRLEAEAANSDAIKVYEQYESGAGDFTKQLETLKTSKVNYVFLPGDSSDVAEIISEANEMNMNVTFLGCNDWASEDFRDLLGEDAEKATLAYVTYIDPSIEAGSEDINEQTQKFLDAYHEKYGEDAVPDENVALGYDAYLIAINAVSEAGESPSGSEITAVLDGHHTFEGVSGDIRFNDVGDPIKTAYISTRSGGEDKLLYTIEPSL